MDIGLITLQRREEIVEFKSSDIKQEANIDYLFVIQNKTKKHGNSAYIKIKIKDSLRKVIERCRDDILSPYLIHRQPERLTKLNLHAKTKKHYTQLTPDYLTKTFAEIRDQISIFQAMPEGTRPTFHEIRSLGVKLYKDNKKNPRALAGHTTDKMTNKYDEGHEIRWTEAEASLDLHNLAASSN